jgi:two-component system, OmpR family, sensor kinase
MSLRLRMLVGLMALVVIGFAAVAATSALVMRALLLEQLDHQLDAAGVLVEARAPGLARGLDLGVAGPTVRAALAPSDYVLELRRPDGQSRLLLPRTDTEPPGATADDISRGVATRAPFSTTAEDGARFRARSIPAGDAGVLVLAAPLAPVQAAVTRMLAVEIVACAGVLIVLGGTGWVLLRRELAPLAAVTATANTIAAGDRSRRVPEAGGAVELGRLARAVNAMLTQLLAALDEQGRSEEKLRRLVADLSHELRTPLTSIRGYTQLLSGGMIDPPDAPAALRRVDAEVTRMAGLVEDMQVLARLDEHRPARQEPVDLAAVVRDHVADLLAVQPDRPVTVDTPASCPVTGDRAGLERVVANLLANVRVHTPGTARLTVSVTAEGRFARLVVTDNGPGMRTEDAARALDRFYRADPSRSRCSGAGSGLGLAIVHDIVTAGGGRVELRSGSGRGVTVTVDIPTGQPPPGSSFPPRDEPVG